MILFLMSLISVAVIGGAVAAGGGGGGGGSAPVSGGGSSPAPSAWDSTVDSAKIASYKTAEYNRQWGLNSIKSAEAYSLLERNGKAIAGDDVLIAISDNGVRSTHQEIANNYDASDSSSSNFNDHGTHVASTAAGVKDGNQMHGVAFKAKIMSAKVTLSGFPGDMSTLQTIQFATSKGAKVINMSWGSASYVEIGSDQYNSTKSSYANDYAAAVSGDIFMSVSAGNDGDNNSTHIAVPAIFAQDSATNGQMIAVGAVDKNNNIAYYSNRCSQAKSNCLVAPGGSGFAVTGDNIYAAISTSNASYEEYAGTSMAAPHVAGAAAVLRAAWPYLSAKQTATILLDTATDLGAAGVDDIYGHGLLDLENAVSAQGSNNIASSLTISSLGSDARSSSIDTNAIFGNAYSKNLAPILKNAVFFDKYGRDYPANLDQKIATIGNNSYNLDNILFTNYTSASLPVSFGKNNSNNLSVKFLGQNTFSDPVSGELKSNKFGLKYLTVDKSKEDQNSFRSSDIAFSYSKNFGQNLKIGFNKNDLDNGLSDDNPAQNYRLISYHNFDSSPYKKLNSIVAVASGTSQSQINTNQLKISQNLTSNLTTNFSFSNYSYSNSIGKFNDDQSHIFDSALDYKFNDKTKFGVSFGNLKELNNNLLGSKTSGAFAGGSNPDTKYITFNLTRNLIDHWQLTSSYSEGKTNIGGNQTGVFRDFSDIRSKAMAVGLLNDNFLGGKLGIVYSEPLRVYKGTANIDIPISRDADGNVQRLTANGVSLKPDGKERDLEFSYNFNLKNRDANVSFNSIIQQQAGNIKDTKDQYFWLARYNLKF
ncbi:MAG: S8 family peptidase [Pseudomonadota bacterium]